MSLENYEGTAIDTSMFDVQSDDSTTQDDSTVTPDIDAQNSDVDIDDDGGEPNTDNQIPTEFEIDGIGKVTVDEIKELKNAGLRQADYTRKTQELAREREQHQDALKLFDYLRSNPHLIAKLKEAEQSVDPIVNTVSPEYNMMRDVARQQKSMEIDMKMDRLKQRYGDVDEIAVYTKATELRTDDLEFVWKGIMADRMDSRSAVEQAKAELKAEIEANKQATSTIVSTKKSTKDLGKQTRKLTAQEKRVAEGMGISEADYLKWME